MSAQERNTVNGWLKANAVLALIGAIALFGSAMMSDWTGPREARNGETTGSGIHAATVAPAPHDLVKFAPGQSPVARANAPY
jgi:hypothetical protein